jgi:hypothetical protein
MDVNRASSFVQWQYVPRLLSVHACTRDVIKPYAKESFLFISQIDDPLHWLCLDKCLKLMPHVYVDLNFIIFSSLIFQLDSVL